jgi:predicted nuclease of predicted toxin-antitoxin system
LKLLFDENLSPRLVALLADAYPGSESVLLSGLGGLPDGAVWNYAASAGFMIVSKDLDFAERAVLDAGVKVIWLRLGNCTTASVHLVLRNSVERLTEFAGSTDVLIELP